MDEQTEWFTIALVMRVAPDVLTDFQEVVSSIPGTQVVFKRISKSKLFITDQPPKGVRGR